MAKVEGVASEKAAAGAATAAALVAGQAAAEAAGWADWGAVADSVAADLVGRVQTGSMEATAVHPAGWVAGSAAVVAATKAAAVPVRALLGEILPQAVEEVPVSGSVVVQGLVVAAGELAGLLQSAEEGLAAVWELPAEAGTLAAAVAAGRALHPHGKAAGCIRARQLGAWMKRLMFICSSYIRAAGCFFYRLLMAVFWHTCCRREPTMDRDDVCRICFEGAEIGPMVSPCACSGTQKHVHRSCLLRWHSEMDARTCVDGHDGLCTTCKAPDGSAVRPRASTATEFEHIMRSNNNNDAGVHIRCLNEVLDLMTDPDNSVASRAEFAACGGLKTLVAILKYATDENVAELAAVTVFACVIDSPDMRWAAGTMGAPLVLMPLLRGCFGKDAFCAASATMTELCIGDDSNREAALAVGVLHAVVGQMDADPFSCSVQISSCRLISTICGRSPKARKEAAACGAVEAVVRMLATHRQCDAAPTCAAGDALTQLCAGSEENKTRALAVGAAEVLAGCMRDNEDSAEAQSECTFALGILVCCHAARKHSAVILSAALAARSGRLMHSGDIEVETAWMQLPPKLRAASEALAVMASQETGI